METLVTVLFATYLVATMYMISRAIRRENDNE